MANISFSGVDEMIKQLSAAGANIDKYAPGILRTAAAELEKEIKGSVARTVSADASGEMLLSVKAQKPRKDKNGVWKVKVGFAGYDHVTGVPNDQKAMAMEYGTSRQAAKPFLRPAVVSVEDKCLSIIRQEMNQVLTREH